VYARRGELAQARRALEDAMADLDDVARRGGFGGRWLMRGPETARDLARMLLRAGDRAAARERLSSTVAALEALDAGGQLPRTSVPMLAALRSDFASIR
jgi:hypothetical protein